MLYKTICLSLMLSFMSSIYSLTITNDSSFPLIVMVQEGQFASNKPSYLLHIECGKDAYLTIAEDINITIAIMQVLISEKTDRPVLNSLYSKTTIFNNKSHIICNNINAVESFYKKFYTIVY